MPYLGTSPQSGFITSDAEKITGQTTNYVNLSNAISSLDDVQVHVNYVIQDPSTLTLNSTTQIGLGDTLVSSDVVLITYLGKAVATQSPAENSVTNSMLAGSIANSKLANSSITLNGSAVSLGGSATVGGTNKGFFYVYKNTLSVASATNTIVTGWSENFDLDNWFASDRYTPQEAGKYVFFYSARADNIGATARFFVALKKNGAGLDHNGAETNIVSASYPSLNAAFVVDMNGSSDYIQSEIYHNQGSTSSFFDIYLQGFKLIT